MATPFIRFPGGAGDRIFTPDYNLVDADSAHMQQSVGDWVQGTLMAGIVTAAVLPPVFGTLHGQADCAATSSLSKIRTDVGTNGFPISPSTEYTASAWIARDTGTTVDTGLVQFRTYDAGGTIIDNVPGADVSLVEIDTWYQAFVTRTVPSNAAFATLEVTYNNPTINDRIYWDAVCLNQSVSPVFWPSLKIVGSSFESEVANPTPVGFVNLPPLEVGGGYTGDVRQWALHDGPDAAAPIVAQITALDALRALPL